MVIWNEPHYDPSIHHRRSIRLKDYEYALSGAYFVTLCVESRVCAFGTVKDESVILSELGEVVQRAWLWLEEHFDHVELDEFIVMPNHLHGILVLTEAEEGGSRTAPTMPERRKPLGRLIGAYKTVSTKQINLFRETPGARLWQRDFFEHVIRGEKELERARHYIQMNPVRLPEDKYNPGQ